MSKRAIFEEVGEAARSAPARAAAGARAPARRAISLWFVVLALMTAAMILVGGLTRLTDSGLSITEWDPVMGAIPPLSEEDWRAAFEAYKTTTEFQEQNSWMTLEDFKPIFWWEWGHRFLGRLIGLVWLAGLVWFWARRQIPPGWGWRMVVPGILGGIQGAVGWWMVASGLVGRLDVASYRLAIHLGIAFLIFSLLLWYSLLVRLDEVALLKARRRRLKPLMGLAGGLFGLVFLQILLGALVAGIDAGRGYVDWPLMQGQILPDEAFDLEPLWRNFFENPALVQFVHRVVGYLVLVVALVFALRAGRAGHRGVARWARISAVAVLAQVVLGIVTVMHASPLEIAILHQAGALAVVAALLRAKFEIAYPAEERLAAA